MAGGGNVDAVAVEFAADGHVLGDNLPFNVLRRVHVGFRRENHGRGCASGADVAVILPVLGFGVGQIVNNTLVRPLGVFGVIDTVHVQLGQSDIVRTFGVNIHDETGLLPQRGGHTITLQFFRVDVDMSDITVGVDVTLVHVGEIMGRVGFRSFRPLGGQAGHALFHGLQIKIFDGLGILEHSFGLREASTGLHFQLVPVHRPTVAIVGLSDDV